MADNSGNTSPPDGNNNDASASDPKEPNELSLEQALLAPLNSILKAQLHSARSFLNLLLQLGYPHEGSKDAKTHRDGEPFHIKFKHYDESGSEQTLKVPALSLVPIAPLAVDSAEFEMEMAVRRITDMQQMQSERKEKSASENPDKRPWYLVEKPVSIQGTISPSETVNGQQRNESQSSIKINVKIKSIPMPSGLDKLLTTLTHMGEVEISTPPPEDNTQQDVDS